MGLLYIEEDGNFKQFDQGTWYSTYGRKENTEPRDFQNEQAINGIISPAAGTSSLVYSVPVGRRYYLTHIWFYCAVRGGNVYIQNGSGNTICNTRIVAGTALYMVLTTPIACDKDIYFSFEAGGGAYTDFTYTLNGYLL